MALAKKYRLEISDRRNVKFSAKKWFTSSSFKLGYNYSKSASQPKIAVIVSKKISKKATARNRIKRLILNAILKMLPKINPKIRLIFIVTKDISNKKNSEIDKEIASAISKLT